MRLIVVLAKYRPTIDGLMQKTRHRDGWTLPNMRERLVRAGEVSTLILDLDATCADLAGLLKGLNKDD